MTTTVENNEVSVAWCEFIWFISKDTEFQDKVLDSIWRFIPTQLWPWCIRILQYKFTNIFGNIKIGQPNAELKDKTNDIDTWETGINTYLLSRLASFSNTYLLPTIKCPWGYSKFQHKAG